MSSELNQMSAVQVAPSGERSQGRGRYGVVCRGNRVWSIPEHLELKFHKRRYTSTLYLTLPTYRLHGPSSRAVNSARELGPSTRVVETGLYTILSTTDPALHTWLPSWTWYQILTRWLVSYYAENYLWNWSRYQQNTCSLQCNNFSVNCHCNPYFWFCWTFPEHL